MSSDHSVTQWIDRLRAGDQAAAERLWERYFAQLVGVARNTLRKAPVRVADEEDVALSVFDSVCRGLRAGRFPRLLDRDNLWGLVVVITARKARNLIRHECRQKRGGGAVLSEGALPVTAEDPNEEPGLAGLVGDEPTPAFAAQVREEFERLLSLLGGGDLRQVALWRMEGYTNEEIAGRLGCVERTVERKLETIRSLWMEEGI
jgi:DNA-directed RNA polymerase specialized sigma24 family protein